jgi:aconitate decarboxylase
VWELIARITAHHNEEFDTKPLGHGQSRVRIRFTDGTTRESYQFAGRSILSPLSNAEIVAKYRSLTQCVIDPDRRDGLQRAVLSIDTSPDLDEFIELLAAPVTAPFATESAPLQVIRDSGAGPGRRTQRAGWS